MGMLTLILVFFMSFAMIAICNQQNVKRSEALVKARLQAETGLQRIYARLATDWGELDQPANFFPATKAGQTGFFAPATGPWCRRRYWASLSNDTDGIAEALHVNLAGVDFTPPPSASFLDNTIGWLQLMDPDGSGAIISRIAYLVIDESGKIDPAAAVQAGVIEGAEDRLGVSPADLNLCAVFDNDTLAAKFQPVGTGVGQMPANARWFSYFHIFKANSSAAASDSEVVAQTVFPYSEDVEAFFNGRITKHRFDLANAAWDGFSNSVANSGIAADATDFWNDSDLINDNTGGIPWFNNCANSVLKNQLIANLIDYCDSDSAATTDNPANPTYTGLERVPYINEIFFCAQIIDDGDGTYTFSLDVIPELVNIYADPSGAGGNLRVNFSISSTEWNPGASMTTDFALGSDVGAESYEDLGSQQITADLDITNVLNELRITVNYAKLTNAGGELWDFAFNAVAYPSPATALNPAQVRMISVEINDPRHNLPSLYWRWSADWGSLGAGTIGSRNSVCNPNPGGDTDTESSASDPWDVSTVFIRNAPPVSMWELGCIHRGSPWRTINLTQFNEYATSASGAGIYSAGDANLLPQIKLSAEDRSVGRMNLNTYSLKALKGLLTGIPLGRTYSAPGGSGNTLAETAAATIANSTADPAVPQAGDWLFENGATAAGGAAFRNRGELAKITRLHDGTAYTPLGLNQNTDAAKEEIIGKLANLCTARLNFFTVIVVAQAIQDLPTNVQTGSLSGRYDPGIDRILAEQKLMAVCRRDAFSNTISFIRIEYLDE